ncbi:Aspartic peptidase [Corchorus capsularis]|uniref:Aspartic peptidase n=1 Tax=Corchorus capsularis TaxID=210143 RepID=A0A1R3HCJ0_COCAP|nr:Aspartic peptidase [Corchorus capsularis]
MNFRRSQTSSSELLPYDSETERTCKANRARRRAAMAEEDNLNNLNNLNDDENNGENNGNNNHIVPEVLPQAARVLMGDIQMPVISASPSCIKLSQRARNYELKQNNVDNAAPGMVSTKTTEELKEIVETLVKNSLMKAGRSSRAMVNQYMSSIDAKLDNLGRLDKTVKSNSASIRNLEMQVSQLSKVVGEGEQGKLPSNTEVNPKEGVMAITLRSGKILEPTTPKEGAVRKSPKGGNEDEVVEVPHPNPVQIGVEENKLSSPPKVQTYVPPIPYPQRLRKRRDDSKFQKLLDIFKKLHINIPFAEALAQMPAYAKFLKEIISNKSKLEEYATVALTEECSVVLLNKLPLKQKDPGSFVIPCHFGSSNVYKCLCDLGASINLMPLSLFRKLQIGELKPTTVSLQLADRSVRHPTGIVKDLLVKVGKLIIHVGFLVMDMDYDTEVPIIVGRPFLATRGAMIDVANGAGYLKDSLHAIEDLGERKPIPLPSSQEAPKPELKLLPSHLKYGYLGEDNTYHVIISSALSSVQEGKLITILREHKMAITWSISDIKSISPSICTHCILMEENHKPSVENQRRLNPNMKEVVCKEVIKLLDAVIINAISDSPWVSPVQVVPKKGGLTVVKNEKNELIPTRPTAG